MEAKTFCLVAGVIFAVVALFHLVRIVMDWSVSRDVLAGVDRLEQSVCARFKLNTIYRAR
jgi:hypothetical protein